MAGITGQLATWGEIKNEFGASMFKNASAYSDNECVSWGDIKSSLVTAGSIILKKDSTGIADNECLTVKDLESGILYLKLYFGIEHAEGSNGLIESIRGDYTINGTEYEIDRESGGYLNIKVKTGDKYSIGLLQATAFEWVSGGGVQPAKSYVPASLIHVSGEQSGTIGSSDVTVNYVIIIGDI